MVARMTCQRCQGRMFNDAAGEASCLMCGFAGPVYAADSAEARALDALSRRAVGWTGKKRLQGAAKVSHQKRMESEAAA